MPSTTVVVLALLPILLFTLWFMSATLTPPPVPENLKNKRIILLIAHPDDESMFFAPSLQALTHPSNGNHLKILCLSTGNADGLGETRRKELETAALTLGVRRREDIFVMDDERFKDGMQEKWEPKEIARVLAQAFAPQLITPSTPSTPRTSTPPPPPPSSTTTTTDKKDKDKDKKKTSSSSSTKLSKSSSKSSSKVSAPALQSPTTPTIPEGPRSTIDILLTFDSHGISSHPNHIALYQASVIFLQQIMRGHTGYKCPLDLYTLTTINILRKYSFIFDLLPTYFLGFIDSLQTSWTASKASKAGKNHRDNHAVFVNDVGRYLGARKAMVSGHKSQMVWFRWGWIGMGRYMVVNDLRRAVVPGA